ncbi:MAG: hypothetical protein JSS72_05205 [Armatimonadetes bacterium]|nr:hypothetical protein [Armatimonadota bacterium]
MRFLTILSSLFLFAGITLLFAFPWLVPKRPPLQDKKAYADYAVHFTLYAGSAILFFGGAVVSSAFLVRKGLLILKEEREENLRLLIEGTLSDHKKKHGGESSQS